jgi:hypothetical protein
MLAERSSGCTFSLPGGLILGDNRRIDEAEIRPLTGREEEWLALHPSVPSAHAVTRLLTDCTIRLGDMPPSGELVGSLLVGDRDYLILQLRRLTLGERFEAVLGCPACAGKLDVAFQAGDIEIDSRPQTAPSLSCELPAGGGNAARAVRFRLPNGADQEAVLGIPPEMAVDRLLDRCLLDDGGRPISAEERVIVSDAMEEAAPQVDLQLDLECPECGHGFTAPFDVSSFFLDEMKINGKQMLREVHLLAFYYHWSEPEILSLNRERRRAYLGLLSDELRQD